MKILITGFEPFGDFKRFGNPSEITAHYLANKYGQEALVLSVDEEGIKKLKKKLIENNYDCIFMMGQGYFFGIKIENEKTIGEYFCGKAYREALIHTNKVVFIHLPVFFYNYPKIEKYLLKILKWE